MWTGPLNADIACILPKKQKNNFNFYSSDISSIYRNFPSKRSFVCSGRNELALSISKNLILNRDNHGVERFACAWNKSQAGASTPSSLFSVAEKKQPICPIGRGFLRTRVCKMSLQKKPAAGLHGRQLIIASAVDEFIEDIEKALKIQEWHPASDWKSQKAWLCTIRAHDSVWRKKKTGGFGYDDFGTAIFSCSNQAFPVNLKVDRFSSEHTGKHGR